MSDVAISAAAREGEDGEGIEEGEDPFSTYGIAYYAPSRMRGVWSQRGILPAGVGMRPPDIPPGEEEKLHAQTEPTVTVADASVGSGEHRYGSVYHNPIHAASAP
jgi:hypothetical protein